ncbi:CDP-diacylglycerol--glycerol-3-phosphate 3-phosphatidyltransferase [Desulfobotulus sp.]|jgi:CDP-diacylglycerol--glycerol-3-phosphate 3-phosphatidyltransferase|uniref:CDP-diacylglycerol--glycerol-3-phosphate 3-phosphatidyltransferase n=1 Tax=Desulfobotulus sp. TaxID=1940337 RepID=UPI002A370931|nr:CDP-diacylglycerol--glycerol-3-phosphate 3-phosphatidyltransferase [Desulfobotulus sp.]MDY0164174.1 CDP-diacylglycerol--glycerol-3-phosphate 3-phosphatidyltransferase [Desulfobotulus sp.]
MTLEAKPWFERLLHPNSLTLYRVAAVPLLVVLLLTPGRFTAFLAALVFSLAAITDFLDGFMARRMGLVSQFGKIMDPLADKLLISSAFIMLVGLGRVEAWIVCVILGRELAITGLRSIMASGGADVAATTLAKWKTGFQIGALIPLLLHYPYLGLDFHMLGTWVLWVAVLLTVWSGVDYVLRARKLIL